MNIKSKIRLFINILLGKDVKYSIQKKCNKIRLGSQYGGWSICPDHINNTSIVYSFGVGEDISFDMEIINKFHCNVYAFDPTPKSIEWLKKQNLPKEFYSYGYGIANYNGIATFYMPANPNHVSCSINKNITKNNSNVDVNVKKLATILNELKHKNIDILKMDIEGSEYLVLEDMLNSNIFPKQILVEFHHRLEKGGIKKTRECIKNLNMHGYQIFDISDSNEEYSFIKV